MQANPGAGPRHFDFHPNGRRVYSLNEETSTLDYLSYDARLGVLTLTADPVDAAAGIGGRQLLV